MVVLIDIAEVDGLETLEDEYVELPDGTEIRDFRIEGENENENFGGRFGVMLGYNNIQSFKFGLSYKITPTSMFKD
jgi:hypothetical protein